MRILLDTQLLLWIALKPHLVSTRAQAVIAEPTNRLIYSSVSLCEVAIKHALGRQNFLVNPRTLRTRLLENAYEELPFTADHAVAIDLLPTVHKDPFDRMLVVQALVEDIPFLTTDRTLARYPGQILMA